MMKKLFKVIAYGFAVIGVIAVVIIVGIKIYGVDEVSSPERVAKSIARSANKNIPFFIDTETILVKASAKGKQVIYEYKMKNINLEDIEPDDFISTMSESNKDLKTGHFCVDSRSRRLLKIVGVVYLLKYYDKSSQYIGQFNLDAESCKLI